MSKDYYYIKDDKSIGPFNYNDFINEDIGSETLVWCTGE